MAQEQYKNQEKQEQKKKDSAKGKTQQTPKKEKLCPNCGAAYDEGDLFCPECGYGLSRHCPHCNAEITPTCEICPVCGRPIDELHCPFCGAEYDGDEPFCPECGSPRGGITCPKCGTLSFRSFCSHCNTPLNDNALQALALAQQDPKFQKVCKLNQEMAQLEAYLFELKAEIEEAIAAEEEEDGPDAPGLSEEGEKLRAQYEKIMKLLGNAPVPQQQVRTEERASVKKKRELKLKFADAEQIMEEYKNKAAEMQAALADMCPDANMTPAQQRDYTCARKVPEITVGKEIRTVAWVCNFCSCWHNQPSECAEPWHGGTWIKDEVTVETKVWRYLD